jgi:hypothetical protein
MEHAGYLAQVANVDSSVVQTVGQGHTVHRGRATNIHVFPDYAFTKILFFNIQTSPDSQPQKCIKNLQYWQIQLLDHKCIHNDETKSTNHLN